MSDTMAEVNEIIASDLPEVDKLVRSFSRVIGWYLECGQQELDLHRAIGDQESLVKTQIKLSAFEHCRSILQRCYQMVIRGRADDGQTEL